MDGRGNAYVNGGGSDFVAGEEFAPGFVALVTPDGDARQVADGIAMANGMAVTPDNSTLIVAESYGKRLTAFDIAADGDLSNRRVWADLGDGFPDGIRRRRLRRLVRGRPERAVRPGARGRPGAADGRPRPRVLRVRTRGRGRQDPVPGGDGVGRRREGQRPGRNGPGPDGRGARAGRRLAVGDVLPVRCADRPLRLISARRELV